MTVATAFGAPALAALDEGQIHVWRIDLDRAAEHDGRLWAVLCPEEVERAARFRFARDRVRFVAAHAALRQILAGYLEAPASALRFAHGGHGKPALTWPWSESGLRFNLSHSHGVALCGVALGRELGVDVERVRLLEDLDGLAERVFSPREREALGRLEGVARIDGFFNGWTRKEAYIKAVGEGLSHPLDRFDVSLTPGAPARIERIDGDAERARQWTLLDVDVDAEYAAAVVVRGGSTVLVRRQWPDDLIGPQGGSAPKNLAVHGPSLFTGEVVK